MGIFGRLFKRKAKSKEPESLEYEHVPAGPPINFQIRNIATELGGVDVRDLTYEEYHLIKHGLNLFSKSYKLPLDWFMENLDKIAFGCAVLKAYLLYPFGGFFARAGQIRFRPFLPDDFNIISYEIMFGKVEPKEWIPEHHKEEQVRVLLGLIDRKTPLTKAYQMIHNGRYENVEILEWIYDKDLDLWLARFPSTKILTPNDTLRVFLIPFKRGVDEPKPFGVVFSKSEWELDKVLVQKEEKRR